MRVVTEAARRAVIQRAVAAVPQAAPAFARESTTKGRMGASISLPALPSAFAMPERPGMLNVVASTKALEIEQWRDLLRHRGAAGLRRTAPNWWQMPTSVAELADRYDDRVGALTKTTSKHLTDLAPPFGAESQRGETRFLNHLTTLRLHKFGVQPLRMRCADVCSAEARTSGLLPAYQPAGALKLAGSAGGPWRNASMGVALDRARVEALMEGVESSGPRWSLETSIWQPRKNWVRGCPLPAVYMPRARRLCLLESRVCDCARVPVSTCVCPRADLHPRSATPRLSSIHRIAVWRGFVQSGSVRSSLELRDTSLVTTTTRPPT